MIRVRINSHDVHNLTLRRLAARRLRPFARRGVAEALEILADEIRARAPVDTGALRDSIAVELNSATSSGEVVVGGNGAHGSTHYAMFKEFGTVYMPAEPFMRPGAVAAQRRIARALARSLADAPRQGS